MYRTRCPALLKFCKDLARSARRLLEYDEMAFLNTPAVQPSEYSIELMAPGRSTFRNIVDGRDRIFSRGVAYWQGFFEWGPYSK